MRDGIPVLIPKAESDLVGDGAGKLLVAAMAVPIIPLVLRQLPLLELLDKLGGIVIGGLPG